MCKRFSAPSAITVFVLLFAGCEKRSGGAVILEKEHIAARESAASSSPAATPVNNASEADQITVDSYVMRRGDRGTSRDPRAMNRDQWLVKVRMISDSRRFNVHVEPARWQKLKEGDRVSVSYKVGKYTGTVWEAEIR